MELFKNILSFLLAHAGELLALSPVAGAAAVGPLVGNVLSLYKDVRDEAAARGQAVPDALTDAQLAQQCIDQGGELAQFGTGLLASWGVQPQPPAPPAQP